MKIDVQISVYTMLYIFCLPVFIALFFFSSLTRYKIKKLFLEKIEVMEGNYSNKMYWSQNTLFKNSACKYELLLYWSLFGHNYGNSYYFMNWLTENNHPLGLILLNALPRLILYLYRLLVVGWEKPWFSWF